MWEDVVGNSTTSRMYQRSFNDQYLGGNNTNTNFFSESHLLVVRVGRCVSHCQKKTQKFSSVPSEFWCVFSGWKSRTKEPNSWSSIEHFSVSVAIGVWDLCLKGQTPCGELQRFSYGWDRGTSRCMTLLMPHVPQQLQRRCGGVDSNHAGYGNALPRNFGVTGKNITLSVGLTWWLRIKNIFWVYLGDSITKASSSNSFLLFCPWNYHGMHWKAVWKWDNPTILAGRKQMLVCSAAWKVHASRGSVPGCQMILVTRWCLVRFVFPLWGFGWEFCDLLSQPRNLEVHIALQEGCGQLAVVLLASQSPVSQLEVRWWSGWGKSTKKKHHQVDGSGEFLSY